MTILWWGSIGSAILSTLWALGMAYRFFGDGDIFILIWAVIVGLSVVGTVVGLVLNKKK